MWLFLAIALFTKALALDENSLVDCHPDPDPNSHSCSERNCIWSPPSANAPVGTPSCYFPRETGCLLKSQNGNTYVLQPDPATTNPFSPNLNSVTLTTGSIGKTLTVSIGASGRYVPPTNFPMNPSSSSDSLQFFATTVPGSQIFGFKVTRTSTGTPLWDTTIGGFFFGDQFIQIATYLPSSNLYGFGEHVHKQLRHDLSRYTTWPMFARDIPPDSGSALSTQNLYGVHPFYILMEHYAHGVLILNSNAQEVVTGPGPHLVYRTIGGQLDIAFFPGPTPEEVVQQYLAFIGTPFLPAYWGLGFQLSRWGYHNLTDMQNVIARNQAAGIPLDVPYADIDYMRNYEDFTDSPEWSGFPQYAQQLHSQGMHLIVIFDPAVEVDYGSFQRAIQQNASFVEWPEASQVPHDVQDKYPLAKNTQIMLGNVWPPNNTAFPDFLDTTNNTNDWWYGEFKIFHDTLGFDGMWIDMNEPSNFETGTYSSSSASEAVTVPGHLNCPISGPDSSLDNPPYQTYAVYGHASAHLNSRTLCMLGKTMRRQGNFYDTKNLYGWSEARATMRALTMLGKRGAVISRSTFPSSGRYGGHWLGDNTARWADLQTSVIGAMEFNFFGIPYVGSDICGFQAPTNEELCLRWQQMGAFHPFSRNHNMKEMPAQDPAVWPSVTKVTQIANTFRYHYLPYLYSLHYRASLLGGTVIRPLFFEFPTDSNTFNISEQFLWGSAMMIAPALRSGVTTVHAYFPNDTWYSLVPESYGQTVSPGYNDVPARNDSLTPVYVRGGYILPRQGANVTTTVSRLNPMEILITMSTGSSSGELYWDAGDDVVQNIQNHPRHHWLFTFTTNTTSAVLNGLCDSCSSSVLINTMDIIEILGYKYSPNYRSFALDGIAIAINTQTSTYSAITRKLYIQTKGLIPLQKYAATSSNSFVLAWKHS